MKLLFLTPQLPYPPKQGTALRNWGLISHLSKRHQVWLLSFDDTGSIHPVLQSACKAIVTFPTPRRTKADRLRTLLTSAIPDMGWRLWSPEFAAKFDEWVAQENFDIIQIEGIELARYALQSPRWAIPSAITNHQSRIVFDDHNCEYLMQQRWFERDVKNPKRWHAAAYSFVQWRRLITLERAITHKAHATLCVSPQDRDAIQHLDPAIKPHVILNGIDVAAYEEYEGIRDWRLESMSQSPVSNLQSLVFTGKMDFRPNIDAMLWFAEAAWPMVKQAHPHAQLRIVGQKPSPRLDGLRSDPNIVLTGEVADIRPHIAQANVYIAPLRIGSGTRFKLLEAMAMRKAIVSTSLGCEGFEVTNGREMMIADEPTQFAQAVNALLSDEARCAALGEAAYQFVSATYDWAAIVPKLEAIYRT
jgi:sugar transferase (PEP-CTERM/EpsH1 system associated)